MLMASLHREWLILRLRSDWNSAGKTHAAGALIAADLESSWQDRANLTCFLSPASESRWTASPRRATFFWSPSSTTCEAGCTSSIIATGSWQREALPGLPEFGDVSVDAIDPDLSDDYFLHLTDFLTPSTLALGTVGSGPAVKLKQLPAFFDAESLAVSQHEAVSQDGTRVPYFEVARKDLVANGKNPTLLYGYGGFEISMLPSYRPAVGAAWLEKGGVLRRRQHPRRRRVRPEVASVGDSRRTGTGPTTTSSPSPKT